MATFGSGFSTPAFRSSFEDETQPKQDELFNFATGEDGKQDLFNIQDTELFKQSADTAQQQMAGDVPGFDAQANEARESMIAGQAYREKAIREGLLGQGLGETGRYLEEGIIAPAQEKQREREAFERGLTSDKAMLGMQQQQAGQAAASNLLGLQQTGQAQNADLALREREMVNSAMQFTSKQDFDKWAILAGFDENERARAWQSAENAKGISSTEKMFFANLSLDEQKFYEDARQFNTKMDFDKWALEQGLAENERQRIWQAVQNDKELANRVEIATMQTDLERWKQGRVEAMQQAGFDQETALLRAQQEYEAVQADLDRQLTREVEQGRLSLEEKKLAQDASQFQSQQDFERWALEQGWSQDAIARSWQASENATQRAFLTQQANLDRILQSAIEQGKLNVEWEQLAQQARQFDTEMEFQQWAMEQGWEQDAIARSWQASEYAQDRALQLQMQAVDNELQRYGINLAAVMPYLESLPPEQAAAAFNALAGSAGFTYTDANGNEVPGFPPADESAVMQTEIDDSWMQLQTSGTITGTQAADLLQAWYNGSAPEDFNPSTTYLQGADLGDYMYDPPGKDGKRGWYLKQSAVDWAEANLNQYFVRDGQLVQLIGYYQPSGDQQDDQGYITYRNVVTGDTINDVVRNT